ncbi:MAG: tRNA (N6-isopentenyl adenosine(37)-C2)-methylthiotransferase MiaB [Syntrophobacteraceae bacterium]|jgi:tRNA-2-methylthio-N6-dimethylallyladenosine synthase|nr:tRNA (N6-isopentenyl adenosine(37)-C2)-methylthiotransferase MiaB [Syntrophobacteraceae bacterium]
MPIVPDTPIARHGPLHLYAHTIGCQMNEYDTQRAQHILGAQGYTPTTDIRQADVIFLNTCSVRAKAEQKVHSFLGRLRRLKKDNPRLIIIVAGCVAQQLGPDLLRRFEHLDLVLGTRAIPSIGSLLQRVVSRSERLAHLPESEEEGWESLLCKGELTIPGVVAPVTIMQGCDNFCSYCIVPHVRGRERSRRSGAILHEIDLLTRHGVKEVLLLGQNVNSYGKGLEEGLTFTELLRRIHDRTSVLRIRFTTSHPKDLTESLMGAFAELPRLCRWIHLPFQSGSDRILRQMNRSYTAARYMSLIDRLRSLRPDMGLSADVMVGFPGETEEDFRQTMQLIAAIRFDNLFSFSYSDRPGTSASQLPDKIPADVKARRLQELQKLQMDIVLDKNRAEIGGQREVLVEGFSKQSDGNQLTGRTEQNRIVNFQGPVDLVGQLVTVRIHNAFQHSLLGERTGHDDCRWNEAGQPRTQS